MSDHIQHTLDSWCQQMSPLYCPYMSRGYIEQFMETHLMMVVTDS